MGFTIDTYQSMETRTAVLRLYRRIAPKAALLMVVYYCECFAVTNFAAALVLDRFFESEESKKIPHAVH